MHGIQNLGNHGRDRADSVLYILRNEKYVGDCENQKYVTKNFLTHEAHAQGSLP